MSHNISKHRLKHDEFADDMMKTVALFRKYGTEMLAILAGAIIIIIGLFFVAQNKAKNEKSASMTIASAHSAMFSGDAQQAKQAYEDIIKRFGGTETAKEAMVFLGNINFQMRNPDEAIKNYERAVSAKPKSYLIASAAISGIAACYEQKGDFNKAAEEYLKISVRFSKQTYLASTSMMSAGRCYVAATNFAKAREVYQNIINKFPQDQASQKAKESLALMPPLG